MKYAQIDPALFIQNRANFVKQLKPCSLAVFNSNDVMPTNADGTMAFRQNNDLFYLSGVDQEESVLLLFPDAKDQRLKEILFVRETNDQILTWEGYKLTKEQAQEVSGIKTIMWTHEFQSIFQALMHEVE
ncbi:MAG TPA: aminopeptidase P N-terminal domain-containing protein, partial [Adhaeribacter sp.]|nr:aminopeptidase P N-terminal domain-containing protein [Adhaeribacter sp.]